MKVLIPQNNSLDLNGDGRVTIDELARSTMLIFIQLVVVFSALVGAVYLLVVGPALVRLVGGVIGLSAVCAFGLGVYRMLRFERLERRDKTVWDLEYRRTKWEFDQARGVADEAGATTMSQAQIDAAVHQILSRYYTGKEWNREALEKAGVMTAEVWNEANAMLKKRRIRKGRKRELEPETFAEAWGIYCEAKLRANQYKMNGRHDSDWREAA